MAANIIADTQTDELTREILRNLLRQARTDLGMMEKTASANAGRVRGWVARMESRNLSSSERWTWDDIYRWGRAVGRIVRPNPVNINLSVSEHGPFTLLSLNNPDFGGVALLEIFRQIHEATGAEQIELANALGVGHGSMWALLNSDNPRIITLQRFARALGGELRFELEKCEVSAMRVDAPF